MKIVALEESVNLAISAIENSQLTHNQLREYFVGLFSAYGEIITQQRVADGEDIAQMLVQRDQEADAQLAAAREENARLREALKPFAVSENAIERWFLGDNEADIYVSDSFTLFSICGDKIEVKNLRRAAQVLAETEPTP